MDNIFRQLAKNASEISEEDINTWVIDKVLTHFKPKMNYLAYKSYGKFDSDIPRRAFEELAIPALEKALFTFFIKSEHWRQRRKLEPYLLTCLNRLSSSINSDVGCQAKVSVPVCPACKFFNQRNYLTYTSKKLRCNECFKEVVNLEDRISTEKDPKEKSKLESEILIRRVFQMHSRKGNRCPSCSGFIPTSHISGQSVSCPYDSDCHWFGHIDELEPMTHPVGLCLRDHLSLNDSLGGLGGDSNAERQDLIASSDITPDAEIEAKYKFKREIEVLYSVISDQARRLDLYNETKVIKKKLMYQAFKEMLDTNPEDMVSYLVHKNYGGELPIQSRIFQKFISIVEESLPLEVIYEGKKVEVYSIQDHRLSLFTGRSEFETHVREDGTIPNMTSEVYVGGRLMKNAKPCFIGQLVDIIAVDIDESIVNLVDFYTFSYIKMKEDVPPGIKVKVVHFRIPSHYEMNGLVNLQRIRKKIVKSVSLRLDN